MKFLGRLLAATAVCLAAFVAPASAQYMYLDVNGDGVNTAADILTPTSTGVDVWLRTNVNGDGSAAVCTIEPATALTINSYELFVRASAGTMTLGAWTDLMGYPTSFGDFQAGTDAYHGRAGAQQVAGTYKLGRLALSNVIDGSVLSIVAASDVNPPGYTSFGTNCPGGEFDNTYKLGSDWTDVGNTRLSGTVNQNPVITAPATATVAENAAVSITASATDADNQNVTLSQTNSATFLTGPASAGPALNPSIALTGTPDYSQSGTYTIYWSAVDNTTGTATDSTVLTVTEVNRDPVITAPASAGGAEGVAITVTATASDPDGALVGLAQNNDAPFFLSASSDGPSESPSITLTGTPDFNQAGTYTINWSANDLAGGTPTFTTTVTITNTDRPVVLDPIADITVAEGSSASTPVSATDPDGDAVSLTPNGFPAFAVLNPPTSGVGTVSTTVTASPVAGDAAGSPYAVSITATSGATSDTENFQIIVSGSGDAPPVLAAIGAKTIAEGASITYPISATDSNGDIIQLSVTLPTFGTLNPPTSGTGAVTSSFTLAPGAGTAGVYTGTVTATANGLTDSETFSITVTGGTNQVPTISAPATQVVDEGQPLTFQVTAADGDGDPLAITATGVPSGATFLDNGNGTANFTWTPNFTQAGSYTVVFNVNDGNGGTNSATTVITVNNVNRCPTADANGPYSGSIGGSVAFSGAGSSDPDNTALTYAWTFGDGGTATGQTATHVYATAGTFNVVLTVSDGICADTDATTATISGTGGGILANVFTTPEDDVTNLRAAKPTTCVQIEPVNGSFSIANVDLASIKMISIGTGSVSEIMADAATTHNNGDKNHNGVDEIEACFTKANLRLLFSALPAGINTVTVTITGNLTTGGTFSATLAHTVRSTGEEITKGKNKVRVSPNPLNPTATISFQTSKPGRVTVKIYDLNGRLVKTLLDGSREAGFQDLTWNGTTQNGAKVVSGVYYVRLDSPDGRSVTTATVLK